MSTSVLLEMSLSSNHESKDEKDKKPNSTDKEPKQGCDCCEPTEFLDAPRNVQEESELSDVKHTESCSSLTTWGSTASGSQGSTFKDKPCEIPKLVQKLTTLSILDKQGSKNIALPKLYHNGNKSTSEEIFPLCRMKPSFRLDSPKSIFRTYVKSSNLDVRPRRRISNLKPAIFPSTMGIKHSVSSTRNENGMQEILKRSFMVNKIVSKSFTAVKGKTKILQPLDTSVKQQSSSLNCSDQSQSNTIEESSYQENIKMNNQEEELDVNPSKSTSKSGNKCKREKADSTDVGCECRCKEEFNSMDVGSNVSHNCSQMTPDSCSHGTDTTYSGNTDLNSINRILDWDPWAGLKLGEDTSVNELIRNLNDDIDSMEYIKETGKDITVVQSAPSVPVMPILKRAKSSHSTGGDILAAGSGLGNFPPSGDKRSRNQQQGGDADVAACEGDEEMAREGRRVQWSQEVQVIYYAGDTDEGTVLGTQIEPLREEEDQQARTPLLVGKNDSPSPQQLPPTDPWFPILRFNK